MPDKTINIYIKGNDDASGPINRVNGALDEMSGGVQRHTSALGRMAEVAGGILGAQLISRVGNMITGTAKEAFQATVAYERLSMAMESMSKRDLMRASTLTEVVTVGWQEVQVTAASSKNIEEISLKRDVLIGKLQEEKQKHIELIARYGEEGLAVKTHAAEIAQDQFQIDKLTKAMGEVGAATSKKIPITETHTKSIMSEAEAAEMASKNAKELLVWIEDLAVKSPFTAEGVQQAFKTAMAYGFVTDQAADLMLKTGQLDKEQRSNTVTAQRLTKAMLDFAAGTGADAYAMERISRALGQIQAKGKLSGEEVRQLMESGLAVDQILANAFGKSIPEIVAMREKGLIPANEGIQAIVESLEKDFGGAGEKMTQTFAGLVSTMQDVKAIGSREFFRPIFEAIRPYLALFVDFLSKAVPMLRDAGAKVGALATKFLSGIEAGVKFVAFLKDIASGAKLSEEALAKLPEKLRPLAAGIGAAFQAGGLSNAVNYLKPMVEQWFTDVTTTVRERALAFKDQLVGNLVGALRGILDWWDAGGGSQLVLGTIQRVGEWLRNTLSSLGTAGGTVQTGLWAWVGKLWGVLVDWWNAGGRAMVGQILTAIGQFLVNVIAGLQAMVVNYATQLGAVIASLWGKLVDWWNTGGQEKVTATIAAIGTWINGVIVALAAQLGVWAGQLATWASGLWGKLTDWWNTGGQEQTTKTLESIGTWINDVIVALGAQLGVWAGQLATWAGELWGNLTAWWYMKGGQEQTTKTIEGIGKWIADVFVALWQKQIEWGGKLVAWLSSIFNNIGSFVGEHYKEWAAALGEAMGLMFGLFLDFLFNGLPELVGKLLAWASTLFDSGGTGGGKGFISGLFKVVGDLATGLWNFWVRMWMMFIEALYDSGPQQVKDVIDWFLMVINKVVDGIKWVEKLVAQGKALVQGIHDGVTDMVDATKSFIDRFVVKNIEGAVKWVDALFDSGKDVIQGLIAGLEDAKQDVLDWVESLVGNIINAVKKLFGIKSPSTVFAAIGVEILQGLIQGFKEAKPAAVKAMTDAMSAVMDAVIRAVEAFAALNSLPQIDDLQEKLARLSEYISKLIVVLRNLATAFKPAGTGLPSARVFAEAILPIVEGIRSIVEAFAYIGQLELAEDYAVRFASFVDNLRLNLPLLIRALADVAKLFKAEALLAATSLVEATAVIAGAFKTIVDGFVALDDYVATDLSAQIRAIVGQLVEVARQMALAVEGFAIFGSIGEMDKAKKWMEDAAKFAQLAGMILQPILTAVDVFSVLARYLPENVSTQIRAIVGQLVEVARQMALAVEGFAIFGTIGQMDKAEKWMEDAAKFAQLAGMILQPILAAMDVFYALARYLPKSISVQIGVIVSQLVEVARQMALAVEGFAVFGTLGGIEKAKRWMEDAAKFAQLATIVVQPLMAMMDAFKAVAGYAPKQIGANIRILIDQLAGTIRHWLRANVLFSDDALEAALQMASVAQAIVAPLNLMVQTFALVADYVPKEIGTRVRTLMDQLSGTVRHWLRIGKLFDRDALDAALQMASTAERVVAPLQVMAEAFTAISAYVINTVGPKIRALVDQLAGTIRHWLRIATLFEDDALTAALKMADVAQRIVAPLQAMVEAFTAVAGYTLGNLDIVLPFDALITQLSQLIILLISAAEDPRLDPKEVQAAANFATKAQQIVAPLQAMVQAFQAVASYALGAADIIIPFGALIGHLLQLVPLLIAAANLPGLSPKEVQAAANFATQAQAIVSPLVAMVEAFTAVAGYGIGRLDIVLPFAVLVSSLVLLAQLIKEATVTLKDVDMEAVVKLSGQMQQIVGVVQPGIDAILALAEYKPAIGLVSAVRDFASDLVIVANELRLGLGSISEDIQKAYDDAIAFAGRITSLVGVIQPGIEAIRSVARYVRVTRIAQAVRAFAADLVIVANELRRALVTPIPGTVYDAAVAFAERIGKLVGVISPGLQAIKSLTDYQAAQNLAAKVQVFVVDLMAMTAALLTWLGTPSEELIAAVQGAAEWSDLLQTLFDFIQPAIETLYAVRDYARPYGVGTGIVTLLRDLQELITWLNTMFANIGPDTVAAAARFAELLALIVVSIQDALAGLIDLSAQSSAYESGALVGRDWITGIIDGLTSRLTSLEALMTYIRGLFPSSPAKHGPFKDLPDGQRVGRTWSYGLASGVGAGLSPLSAAMASLQSAMSLQSGRGPSSSNQIINSPVSVSIGGTFNIRQDADIRRLAEEVGAVIAQQANTQRRMNFAWSAT